MFDVEHFNHLNYIKKEPLTGSQNGMRYLLQKESEGDETYMMGYVWPEPFGFAKTPADQKVTRKFSLDVDGIADAVAWLNEEYEHYRKD